MTSGGYPAALHGWFGKNEVIAWCRWNRYTGTRWKQLFSFVFTLPKNIVLTPLKKGRSKPKLSMAKTEGKKISLGHAFDEPWAFEALEQHSSRYQQ